MSDFGVIARAGKTFRQLLWDAIRVEPTVIQLVPTLDTIRLESPSATLKAQDGGRLSVFLYQITEDPHLKNRQRQLTNGSAQRPPPLALRLHYLVTPLTAGAEGNSLVLGKVLEAMYDNSTLEVLDPVAQVSEPLRVIFETLTIGELAEVWEALREPYRLSLAYQLRVSRLDSRRNRVVPPVGESTREYAEGPA